MKINFTGSRFYKGFTLIEVISALIIISLLALMIVNAMKMGMKAYVKTKDQVAGSKMLEMTFNKLKTIDFCHLLPCDSQQPNYGLQGTFSQYSLLDAGYSSNGSGITLAGTIVSEQEYNPLQPTEYPFHGVLDQIKANLKQNGYDRFTVDITYMRRDLSDINNNGLYSDLVEYQDDDNDGRDDYEIFIGFIDRNSDGDYNDKYRHYSNAPQWESETPNTRIRKVTVKIWKRDKVIMQGSELISAEMLTGDEGNSLEAKLTLVFDAPRASSDGRESAYLYNRNITACDQAYLLGVNLGLAFPAEMPSFRADPASALRFIGKTDPNATVYVGLVTALDASVADVMGDFNFQSAIITSNLVEGNNYCESIAVKSSSAYSPYKKFNLLLDIHPPNITNWLPVSNDTMKTRAVSIGAILQDVVVSTDVVSGICKEVIYVSINGNPVTHSYNNETGLVCARNSSDNANFLILDDNQSYEIAVTGGDKAHYAVQKIWQFNIAEIPVTDNSVPSIVINEPPNNYSGPKPDAIVATFSDNQSGIDPYSIELSIDGNIYVDSSNVAQYFDGFSSKLTFPLSMTLASGSYTITIKIKHWASDPAANIEAVKTRDFQIN
ncbi:MAG: prepilin-type N-terminal cleavage/methylation domain-containing protein [bacterium]